MTGRWIFFFLFFLEAPRDEMTVQFNWRILTRGPRHKVSGHIIHPRALQRTFWSLLPSWSSGAPSARRPRRPRRSPLTPRTTPTHVRGRGVPADVATATAAATAHLPHHGLPRSPRASAIKCAHALAATAHSSISTAQQQAQYSPTHAERSFLAINGDHGGIELLSRRPLCRPLHAGGWDRAAQTCTRRQGPDRAGHGADQGDEGRDLRPEPGPNTDAEPSGAEAQGKHRLAGRDGVQRPGAGAHQRAARHGRLRGRALRRGGARRRPPLAGRQRRRPGLVRHHRRAALRGVAGAAAPGTERREQVRRHLERRRRALERPLRHARPRRARRHRVHHRRALRQRLE